MYNFNQGPSRSDRLQKLVDHFHESCDSYSEVCAVVDLNDFEEQQESTRKLRSFAETLRKQVIMTAKDQGFSEGEILFALQVRL